MCEIIAKDPSLRERCICSMHVVRNCLFFFLITNLLQATDTQTSNKSNLNLMGLESTSEANIISVKQDRMIYCKLKLTNLNLICNIFRICVPVTLLLTK